MEVAGGKGVGLTAAECHVGRRPRTDARDRHQRLHECVVVEAAVEDEVARDDVAGHDADGLGATPDDAQCLERRVDQRCGTRKRPVAVRGHDAAENGPRRGDGDLLSDDGANRCFEAGPTSRHADAGPLGDHRGEERIGAEVRVDRVGVGAEVEESTCTTHDRPQARGRREIDGEEHVVAARFERDRSRLAIDPYRAPVRAVEDGLEPIDGPRREPVEQRRSVEWRSDGETEPERAGRGCPSIAPEFGRGRVEGGPDHVVALTDAAESGGERHVGDTQVGLDEQTLRQVGAPAPGDGVGGGTDVVGEEAA